MVHVLCSILPSHTRHAWTWKMEQIQSINKSNNLKPYKEKQPHERSSTPSAHLELQVQFSSCRGRRPKEMRKRKWEKSLREALRLLQVLRTRLDGRWPNEMREIVVGSLMAPPSGEDRTKGRQPVETSKIVVGSPWAPPSIGGIRVNIVGIRV